MNQLLCDLLKATFLLVVNFLFVSTSFSQDSAFKQDSIVIRSIYDEVLTNGDIYENLQTLTKGIGHRLSGSYQAAQAMVWGADLLKKYEADNVFVMPVLVPSWSRNDVLIERALRATTAATLWVPTVLKVLSVFVRTDACDHCG